MSSISPEMRRLPEMIGHFNRDGLLSEIIHDVRFGPENGQRNFVEDMRRIFETQAIWIEGEDNLPADGGLIVFNHPEVHIIAPAIYSLPAVNFAQNGKDNFAVVMGSELPLFGDLFVPGSPQLISRFTNLYPGHFILTPTSKHRRDYVAGREVVRKTILDKISAGGIVAIAPEGRVSVDGTIQPLDIYRHGSGDIGQLVSRAVKPIIPVGVWQDDDGLTNINIGPAFGVRNSGKRGAVEMMLQIAEQLPKDLRGPFRKR